MLWGGRWREWETSCAAAALATVLTFSHNDPVSEKTVAQGMLRSTDPIKVKVRDGFSLLDMTRRMCAPIPAPADGKVSGSRPILIAAKLR